MSNVKFFIFGKIYFVHSEKMTYLCTVIFG